MSGLDDRPRMIRWPPAAGVEQGVEVTYCPWFFWLLFLEASSGCLPGYGELSSVATRFLEPLTSTLPRCTCAAGAGSSRAWSTPRRAFPAETPPDDGSAPGVIGGGVLCGLSCSQSSWPSYSGCLTGFGLPCLVDAILVMTTSVTSTGELHPTEDLVDDISGNSSTSNGPGAAVRRKRHATLDRIMVGMT